MANANGTTTAYNFPKPLMAGVYFYGLSPKSGMRSEIHAKGGRTMPADR